MMAGEGSSWWVGESTPPPLMERVCGRWSGRGSGTSSTDINSDPEDLFPADTSFPKFFPDSSPIGSGTGGEEIVVVSPSKSPTVPSVPPSVDSDVEVVEVEVSPTKKRRRRTKEEIQMEKQRKEEEKARKQREKEEGKNRKLQEKEEAKLQKDEEKERKKREKEAEKAKSQLARENQRRIAKDKAEEFVTTLVGEGVQGQLQGCPGDCSSLEAALDAVFEKEADKPASHRVAEHLLLDNSLAWSKRVLDEDTGLETEMESDQLMIVLSLKFFLEKVQGSLRKDPGEEDLTAYANQLQKDIFPQKKLSLVVVGMGQYWKDWETLKNRRHRAAVTGAKTQADPDLPKHLRPLVHIQELSKEQVHEALVDLQLFAGVQHWLVDKLEDLADLIRGFHKGVAQEEKKKQEMSRPGYAKAVKKGGDLKTGNEAELRRTQFELMLQQLPGLTESSAKAISAKYASVQELWLAYGARGKEAGAALLKDIRVSRGGEIGGTQKPIGLALSRKIHTLFTADDPETILS